MLADAAVFSGEDKGLCACLLGDLQNFLRAENRAGSREGVCQTIFAGFGKDDGDGEGFCVYRLASFWIDDMIE